MLSDIFYIVNFSFSILISIVGMIVSISMISIVATHRPLRTVTNLLTCNTSMTVLVYFISILIPSVYGFREDWASKQPLCIFRAYCSLASCACLCYSYALQAMGRFFSTVLYKHKFLVTYRVQVCLILLNWTLGVVLPIVPIFFDGGFVYEKEARLCVPTTHRFLTSMYGVTTAFIIPLNIAIIVYSAIFYHTRRSSRRVVAFVSDTMAPRLPNAKREMTLARNMLVLLGIFGSGGLLYLVLVLWNVIEPVNSPPESLYLLSNNSISFFIALMMLTLFHMNKQVKDTALGYLYHENRHIRGSFTLQQRTAQVVRS